MSEEGHRTSENFYMKTKTGTETIYIEDWVKSRGPSM